MKEKKNRNSKGQLENLEDKKRKNNEWIMLSSVMLIGLLYVLINAITKKNNSEDYYVASKYLFIVICFIFFSSLFQPGGAKLMIDSFGKLLKNPKQASSDELGLSILLITNLLAMVSFIFVDFAFFQNTSLKISAVVAFQLFFIIKTYFRRK